MTATVNKFLRGDAAMQLLLMLALFAQTPHTASVFHRLAPVDSWLGWLHAASYAVALELATLVFVVRMHKKLSWTFALVSLCVNVAYYYSATLTGAQWMQVALVSIALPSCIAFYSHAMVHDAEVVAIHSPVNEESSLVNEESSRKSNAMQLDAKALYLQRRAAGEAHAALVQQLQLNSNTALSWWTRRNATKGA